jgi:hypothetical protein
MAADSTRRPREKRFPQKDGDHRAEGLAAGDGGGETLAEKIRRYRQPGSGASGAAPASGTRVVRAPRDE